mgnify:CR=1 FL=1
MRIDIDDININDRIRRETGDLSLLMRSIKQVGLIHPIIVDENNQLLSGYRRLQACRQLGWKKVVVKVVPVGDDKVRGLDWEFHENLGRLNLTDQEAQDYIETRNRLLHPEPKGIWQRLLALFKKLVGLFKRK